MIKYTTKFLLALSLLMIGGLTAASAQMDSDTTIRANIPMSFVLRDKTYPAGKYTIRNTDDAGDSEFLLDLQNARGKTLTFFETEGATSIEPAGKTQLVFHKIGDQYFLSKIQVEGEMNGSQIAESKAEKELVAANTPMEEMFVVTEMIKVKPRKMKKN